MVQIFWLIIVLMTNVVCAENIPSLDELKKSALTNNIDVVCKQREIAEYKTVNSPLNAVKGVSSYSFESDNKFYGVMLSVPLFYYLPYKKGLLLKEEELEKTKQGIITTIEELYYNYCNIKEKIDISSKEIAAAKEMLSTGCYGIGID